MKENLVIVESPAKAKTIQKFLSDDYVVMPSFGHIRDLQEKKLSIDVNNGFEPEYVIPADKKKVVSDLKKAASKASVVWLASDEDREGEAIAWHLSQTLGLKPESTKRIAFHEITKPAILDAIKNPRDIDMNLVSAQQARRILDRLVGFEISPILWRKIRRGLSAGRVQSVALRLVVDREKEIMAFKPEAYYRVEGLFHPAGSPAGVLVKGSLEERLSGKEQAAAYLEDSKDAVYTVDSAESKEGTRIPPAPFTTSTLQQEASRRLHMSVSQTMRIAQSLYERGLITYMRTDSTNLSTLALGAAKKFINDNFGEEYSRPRQYKTRAKGAQEAHEAIRPTYIENAFVSGTPQEQKLYDLIWKRTVASQMSEARVLNTTIKLASSKRPEKFQLRASQILFDGYLKLYIESPEDEAEGDVVASMPELKVGDVLEADRIDVQCKFTQPPYRYSEGTLVKKLEELGIGRPATWASIISTLTTSRGYILKGDKEGTRVEVENFTLKGGKIRSSVRTEQIGAEKGKLIPQEIGMIVTDYLVENFPRVLSYDFTASVEEDFDNIASGKLVWNELIARLYGRLHSNVEAQLSNNEYSHVSREIGIDPSDGQMIVAKFGQYGPYVQKGEGDSRQFASLGRGQLIESLTLEEALQLFQLPRNIGIWEGNEIIAMKGRFGPYLKWGDKNVSLPRNADPLKVTLEDCVKAIEDAAGKAAANTELKVFEGSGIAVMNGRFGPYLKKDGSNYRIPAGTDASQLTEEECIAIIESSTPTERRRSRRYSKTK